MIARALRALSTRVPVLGGHEGGVLARRHLALIHAIAMSPRRFELDELRAEEPDGTRRPALRRSITWTVSAAVDGADVRGNAAARAQRQPQTDDEPRAGHL